MRTLGAALIALLAVMDTAAAQSVTGGAPSGDATREFAVVFGSASDVPITDGPDGEANARELSRIASVVSAPLPGPDFKLLLVARAPAGDALTFHRSQAIGAAVAMSRGRRDAATAAIFRSFAFDADFKPHAVLPSDPPGVESLHLRLIPSGTGAGPGCPWQVRLADPLLPQMIGAAPAPLHLAISPATRLSARSNATLPLVARAVWELAGHRFAKPAEALLTPDGTLPPAADAKLHLVTAAPGHPVLGEIDRLDSTSRPSPTLERHLPAADTALAKGLGDDVSPIAPGQVIRQQSTLAFSHCAVTLELRASGSTSSSR